MADLKKVKAGDPLKIPAPDYNAMIEAAKAHRRNQINFETEADRISNQSTVFPIRNNSGSDLDRFSILGIGEPVFDPEFHLNSFKNDIAFDGSTPDDDHVGKFAILQEPANDGKIANACYGGVSVVRIDITNKNHGFAEAKIGETGHLESGFVGSAQILWPKTPSEGITWAIVRLGASGARENVFWAGIRDVLGGGPRWEYTFEEVEYSYSPAPSIGGIAQPGFEWRWYPILEEKGPSKELFPVRSGTALNTVEINQGVGSSFGNPLGNGVKTLFLNGDILWPAAGCAGIWGAPVGPQFSPPYYPGIGGNEPPEYRAVVRMYELDEGDKRYWFWMNNIVTVSDPFSCAELAECTTGDFKCACTTGDI